MVLEVSPLTISIEDFGTLSLLANNLISSAFAAPSTGGDVNFTLIASSCSPAISLRELRGITRTENSIASRRSIICIIAVSFFNAEIAENAERHH
ncbi:MAG TPA: hypothetical protein VFZ23_02160 [Pyrinomonadaceae bacterium]